MKYLIIGLGIYGSNLARDLTEAGNEVIGADIKPALVQAIKDYISTAYILDSTDPASLQMLPLSNLDVVVVAIGENFSASIRTVALLKSAGVGTIYARAADKIHRAVLEGMNVNRILLPEQRAAHDLVIELGLKVKGVVSLPVPPDGFVTKLEVPGFFTGLKYRSLELEQHYGLQLIGVSRATEGTNMFGVQSKHYKKLDIEDDTLVTEGDLWVLYGPKKSFDALIKTVQQD